MKHQDRHKTVKKTLKRIRQRMRESVMAALANGDVDAAFRAAKDAFRQSVAQGLNPVPSRCPCGKKWKDCEHRDELLGTHH
jgi:hypothetical protein